MVLTGDSSQDTGLQAIRFGARDYLAKEEINGRQIACAIGYVIERERAEETLHATSVRLQAHMEFCDSSPRHHGTESR